MKLSIIVPIYNVAPYLKKCVDSLLAQDMEDYEIILVDDGSTDDSGVIADEIVREAMGNRQWAMGNRQWAMLRVIHQENAGLSAARNTGTHVAKTIGSGEASVDPKTAVAITFDGKNPDNVSMVKYANAEELLEHIKSRRSVRQFKRNDVSQEDLSKIKSPIQRITMVEQRNSWCDINSITLQKTPVITANVELYADALDMENIKDMNCHNLIINNGRGVFVSDIKQKSFNPTLLQQLIDNNPNVDNFYIYVRDFKRPGGSYIQIKLKNGIIDGIMGKSEKALISKGVLEDFYQKNADFKQWYQKHM